MLTDGSLYRWSGSFEASELVANLDSSVYDAPTLLTSPNESDVAAFVSGNMLELTGGSQVSIITIRITASDGLSSVVQDFVLDVFAAEIDEVFADLQLL